MLRDLLVAVLLVLRCADAFVTKTSGLTRPDLKAGKTIFASTADVGSQVTIKADFEAYSKGYQTVFSELPSAECEATMGKIPSDLKGSYFRCGPAMFSAGSIPPPKTSIIQPRDGPPVPDGQNPERMVQHPFEADGGVLGVTFQGNGETATARYRYVRTIAFTNERRKGQRLYKAMDSTRELGPSIGDGLGNDLHTPLFRHHLLPGLNKFRKNTSNTRVVYWGKRLLSMWEGGQPYKMDGLALSTEGRSQLGGVLKEMDPLGCKMVIDPIKDRAVLYGVDQGSKRSEVTVYEFDNAFRLLEEEGGKVTQDLPGFAMISDMAVTENYSLFIQPPVSTAFQFMVIREPGKVISVEKGPSTLHLVPRLGSDKSPKSIAIPFDGVVEAEMQLINAYEDGSKIILDAIRADGTRKQPGNTPSQWPWASSLEEYTQNASNKSLWRYEIDTQSGSISKELLSDVQCFFGVINPKQSTLRHSQVYMAIGGMGSDIAPPQGVGRFDTSTKTMDGWMPEAFEFCGEPMFAPKGNPTSDDDGYILTVLFNGKTEQSEMVILKSTNIAAGPVARIPLGIGIPHGLHGCFTDSEEATWEGDEIMRRSKLADKMESRGNRWNEVKSDFSGLGLRLDDMEEYFGDSFLS
jgi:all-trans-8'-apo-beta-carotenal 15,15'-oxygenase